MPSITDNENDSKEIKTQNSVFRVINTQLECDFGLSSLSPHFSAKNSLCHSALTFPNHFLHQPSSLVTAAPFAHDKKSNNLHQKNITRPSKTDIKAASNGEFEPNFGATNAS